jgi:hypothetical protein
MTDTDTLYHRLFSHPLMVEHLVRDFVPEAMAVGLDFARMERVSAKFHGERVKTRREGDVIWRVPTREGQDIYLHLLLEFQSSSDWWMAVRAQVYEGLLWQHLIKEGNLKDGDRLPPVLLVVIYNGARAWTAPTDTTGLIALPEGSPLWPWQPRIQYHLLDMGRVSEDKLTGRDSLTSLLVRLERPQEPGGLQHVVDGVIAWFQAHPDYTDLKRLFTALVGQALRGSGVPDRVPDDLREMRTMLATIVEDWKKDWLAEGEARGRAEGEARGRAEGEARGQAKMLLTLMERRFGPLSEDQRTRILSADGATVTAWANRLFDANSVDDLLSQPH